MEVVVTNQASGYFGTLDADGSGDSLSRAFQITNQGSGAIGGGAIGVVTEFGTVSAVPESSNAALLLVGLAALGLTLRRRSVGA